MIVPLFNFVIYTHTTVTNKTKRVKNIRHRHIFYAGAYVEPSGSENKTYMLHQSE